MREEVMKVGIITLHNAKNYGAVLQAYALCLYINQKYINVNAEVIDYRCKYIEDFYNPKSTYSNSLKGKVKTLMAYNKLKNRNEIFDKFEQNFIPLSIEYDKNNIKEANSYYDIYIAGSDMLWHWHTYKGNECFDDNYFLSFVDDCKKKFSYAASFGTDEFIQKYKKYYKDKLSSFNKISVREKTGIDLVKRYVNKEAVCNVDPTLLLEVNEWKKIEKRPNESGYVLLYEVGSISEKMLSTAKRIAKENKIKLIVLCSELNPVKRQGIFGFSPQEFLGWFDNARYIITNSFHGTVFSIIYHKLFLSEISSWTKNNRSMELMEALGLLDRRLDIGANIYEVIDWSKVDERLEILRSNTYDYLESVFNCE